MSAPACPMTLVVNFNSPELNALALALAHNDRLSAYVRPYANKGRVWERALAALPLAGTGYSKTFGRRRLASPLLARLTHEAGILADVCAAAVGRLNAIPLQRRQRWTNALYKSVRESVASAAERLAPGAACVVAYEGFALPAFASLQHGGRAKAVLNYPVAHHRHRRRVRLEEIEREPSFASTWPDFDDWAPGHEERLDEEIRLADGVLVGSTYARDSFVGEGVAVGKIKVIPYGVDLETFYPGPDRAATPAHRRFQVVYAGQLTQRKGLSYLLRGYGRFARANSELLLIGALVGDARAITPHAHLFRHEAHQTRPALARRYREADVFVFPTLVEGMPLVVLEAMACGLPVIVTANGPGDIVRDGIDGFIVPERDPDAICDRLERLYRDRALCVEMGHNAAARARLFSWAAYTTKVQDYLAQPLL